MTNDPFRYPLGRFHPPEAISESKRSDCINQIAGLPAELRTAVADLDDQQLATPYRPGGWTVRQVVHHLADSHLNSYTRFRLALTEENPVVKPYDESAWAELADARTAPIEFSLSLLDCLHGRWILLLRSLSERDFERTLQHPENGQRSLAWYVALYAWHGKHHVAQITELRSRQDW